jgi:hypothetical protein
MKHLIKNDRVSYTGNGARRGKGSWHGAPEIGSRGVVQSVNGDDVMVIWDGSSKAYPSTVFDVAAISEDGS